MYDNEQFDFDEYNIDISHIKDSDKICWQYTKNPPLEEEDNTWFEATKDMYCKLSAITEALAVASDWVHIPKLLPSNILEWQYRLSALFDAGVGFLFTDTPEGQVPIPINLSDLKDHIGFRVHTSLWDTHKFDRMLRHIRMTNHLRELID